MAVFKTNQGFNFSVFSARGGSAFSGQFTPTPIGQYGISEIKNTFVQLVWGFNIQREKSDAIFAEDFLFIMNLPYHLNIKTIMTIPGD